MTAQARSDERLVVDDKSANRVSSDDCLLLYTPSYGCRRLKADNQLDVWF